MARALLYIGCPEWDVRTVAMKATRALDLIAGVNDVASDGYKCNYHSTNGLTNQA